MKEITITLSEGDYARLVASSRRQNDPFEHFLLKKMRFIPQRLPHLADLPLKQLLQKTTPTSRPANVSASERLRDFLY